MSENFNEIKKIIDREIAIVREIKILLNELKTNVESDEKNLIVSQIAILKKYLKKNNEAFLEELKGIGLIKTLEKQEAIPTEEVKEKIIVHKKATKSTSAKRKINLGDFELSEIEKITLKRLKKKKEKKKEVRESKPSRYIQISNKIFSRISTDLSQEPFFKGMKKDLVKANLEVLPSSYISMMFFTTIIVGVLSILAMIFFLFFNFGVELPFITISSESIGIRFLKVFWIPIILPIICFSAMYFYPGVEKKSASNLINQELPFATIHMSAISGALIEPTQIFKILISTEDYPNTARQFVRLLNLINLQGYSLVSALRTTAFNCPSSKLSELLNGLATTMTSGGSLQTFFEKRAETLLLDYRLEKEKYAKSAETFMDIYISVVIAAPMILMLLLIMMKISGIGLGFSTSTIGIMMILGVSMMNVLFLVFLNIRGATAE